MPESKHTPGPWTLKVNEIIADGSVIGTIYGAEGYRDECYEECQANAHLAAAAPDLLAVVEAYTEWEACIILHADWRGGPSGTMPTLTQPQLDRLMQIQEMRNAALAKAKGA